MPTEKDTGREEEVHTMSEDRQNAQGSPSAQETQEEQHDGSITRRTLCIGGVSFVVLLALGGVGLVGNTSLLRPPGGQDEKRLLGLCVRCQKCYEVCPRKVIVPSHIENGFKGMRTPTFDFEIDYCDFCRDENDGVPLCAKNCPSGALSLPADAIPEEVIMGIATIDETTCLAFRNTACQACYDACPYDAIKMVKNRPYIDTERCNGCGACEHACLSLTAGSIVSGSKERAAKVRPVDSVA